MTKYKKVWHVLPSGGSDGSLSPIPLCDREVTSSDAVNLRWEGLLFPCEPVTGLSAILEGGGGGGGGGGGLT